MIWFSMAGLALAALYCVVRSVFDLRQKRYVWGFLGLLAAAAIVTTPVPTHAVKVVLPYAPPAH